MLKRIRHILLSLSAQGFSQIMVSSVLEKLQPSFEEYFGLMILMKYYYYQDFDIYPVLVEFHWQFRNRIDAQYPHDDDARRSWLIRTNAGICASQLKNETDLEMATKNAVRELFSS